MVQAIKEYDPIIAIMRKHLMADERLVSWDKWTVANTPDIYPRYISFVDNGHFPCLTIYRDYAMTDKNRTGYQRLFYYIHGWFKQPDGTASYSAEDQAAYLMQLVTDILDVNPKTGRCSVPEFAMCRLMDSICPNYEKESRTTYFTTRWRIVASKALDYEA